MPRRTGRTALSAVDVPAVDDDSPSTTGIESVQLVRTGTWGATTGTVRITRDDLESMVAAAQDAEVDAAAVRIGHFDPRFDGEPALGWVENLRVEDDALVGDLVDVPSRLAEVLPRAFRRRSAEIAWNVRTPSGREYRAVLTGLALLGVSAPAVKGLDDVLDLYGAQLRQSSGWAVQSGGSVERRTALSIYDGVDDPDTVTSHQGAVQALEALAAHAGRPVPVELLSQVDQLAGLDEQDDDPEEGGMDPERLRELLGLPADATDEQVEEALEGRGEEGEPTGSGEPSGDPGDGEPSGEPGDGDGDGDGDPSGEPEGEPSGDAGDREPELVTLSAGQLDRLRSEAQQGAEARRILRNQEVEETIRTALSEGRIAPADVDTWRGRLREDFDNTRTLLSSLTPVLPTHELGSDLADGREGTETAWRDFDRQVWGDDGVTAERS